MTKTEKRWGWVRSVNGDIDITDRKRPGVIFAAPFITSVRQVTAVCEALNKLEAP